MALAADLFITWSLWPSNGVMDVLKTCPFMAEPFITWSLDHSGTRGWLLPLRPKAVVSHGLYCLAVIVVHEPVVLIMGLSSLPLMAIL